MSSADILANMKRATKTFTDGFVKWDVDLMLAPRAENCVYHVKPKTIGSTFPPASNEAFRNFIVGTMSKALWNFNVSSFSLRRRKSTHRLMLSSS